MSQEISTHKGKDVPEIVVAVAALIRDQKLRSGDRLPSIRELAQQFDVNVNVVRDALMRAETQGWVEIRPRSGAFVRSESSMALNPRLGLGGGAADLARQGENVLHLLDARLLIEVELIGRAASRRQLADLFPVRQALNAMVNLPADGSSDDYANYDVRFHLEIARLGGNTVLFGLLESLMPRFRPYMAAQPIPLPAYVHETHWAIYTALVDGEADQAKAALKSHLDASYEHHIQQLHQTPRLISA